MRISTRNIQSPRKHATGTERVNSSGSIAGQAIEARVTTPPDRPPIILVM